MTSFIKSVLASSSPDDDSKNTPLFLMGHSMGGAEVLCYIAQGPSDVVNKIRGFLCEAPFLAFHKDTKPSIITMLIGRFAEKLLPRRQMLFPLDAKLLSRDPQVQKDFVEDTLCHDTFTLEGMAGNLDRATGLDSGKILITEGKGEGGKTRIWLSHGTKDGICDYKACEKLYERMNDVKDKELKLYDGWYHKCKCLPL
jgi:acylglycerol lipase